MKMGIHLSVGARFIAPDLPPDTSVFDPGIHHRRSIRLRNYDYSQAGAYFITLCTQKRESLFGAVVGDVVQLNEAGRLVQNVWGALPEHYSCVELDSFVVMPNHIHSIVVLNGVGAQFIAPSSDQGAMNRAPTLGEIIRAFKARCTHGINQLRSVQGVLLWQRNYYEHVIRNEPSLQEIREYIANNPAQWANDRENPEAVGAQFIAPNYDDAGNQGAMNRAPTGSKDIKA
ncbi:MAG: transposase [Gallionella sp.]|nr:transposase [Gallionella sp.]